MPTSPPAKPLTFEWVVKDNPQPPVPVRVAFHLETNAPGRVCVVATLGDNSMILGSFTDGAFVRCYLDPVASREIGVQLDHYNKIVSR